MENKEKKEIIDSLKADSNYKEWIGDGEVIDEKISKFGTVFSLVKYGEKEVMNIPVPLQYRLYRFFTFSGNDNWQVSVDFDYGSAENLSKYLLLQYTTEY